jgi:thiamine pyrophosphokinase
MPAKRAFIFANGEIENLPALRGLLRPEDVLISADGGLRHLRALGLTPAVVIGDMDSIPADEAERMENAGTQLLRYPVDKDETDLELALQWAVTQGHRTIRVAGALGGRLDQTLGNVFLLMHPGLAGCDARLDDGVWEVFLIHERAAIHGRKGDIVSLLPMLGPAGGIATQGLRYPLKGETLLPERTRGISNVMLGRRSEVSLEEGVLLCIHQRQLQDRF